MFVCRVPKISHVKMKRRILVEILCGITISLRSRRLKREQARARETREGWGCSHYFQAPATPGYNGRWATTQFGRFTLWHNSRRVTIQLFHRNLFRSNGSDGLHRNDFLLYHVRKTHPLPFHGVIITYYINTSEIPGFSVILKKSYFHREQSRYN